jgi:radical SAM superfamily enzyme YgiQ (UPF0313 family)
MSPHVLAVNPPIHDFAAYDLWSRPLGLLVLSAALERLGCRVTLLDALDRGDPRLPAHGAGRVRHDAFGCGKWPSEPIPAPAPLAAVPRRWRRYGLPPALLADDLARVPTPDVILVTSAMTYWYPGVFETIALLRDRFPRVPILLGGLYATLCTDHAARRSGATAVVPGGRLSELLEAVAAFAPVDPARADWPPDLPPQPAWHLLPRPPRAAAALTGLGCPFRCTYCAAHRLQPDLVRFPADHVVEGLTRLARLGARDVAFYDDALLVDAPRHIEPILERLAAHPLGLRFHTPNGLHPRYLSARLARRLREAGFRTLRLSFESAAPAREADSAGKVTTDELAAAVGHCRAAGFPAREIGVYALAGLPGQGAPEVEQTLGVIHRLGVPALLAWFSPIPGTPLCQRFLAETGADPGEPLLQNNTALPHLFPGPIGPAERRRLAALKTALNRRLPPPAN